MENSYASSNTSFSMLAIVATEIPLFISPSPTLWDSTDCWHHIFNGEEYHKHLPMNTCARIRYDAKNLLNTHDFFVSSPLSNGYEKLRRGRERFYNTIKDHHWNITLSFRRGWSDSMRLHMMMMMMMTTMTMPSNWMNTRTWNEGWSREDNICYFSVTMLQEGRRAQGAVNDGPSGREMHGKCVGSYDEIGNS